MPITPASNINLNLPLTVAESTFREVDSIQHRITPYGVLERRNASSQIRYSQRVWEEIATDVRSVYVCALSRATFFIKNDNTLWGYGRNTNGRLGDGTGIDRSEPVFILDNVATLRLISGAPVFAIQTDKTLLTWGSGNFSPVPIANNVINVLDAGMNFRSGWLGIFHMNTGGIYQFDPFDSSLVRVFAEPVFALNTTNFTLLESGGGLYGRTYFINSQRVLVQRTMQGTGRNRAFVYREIATDVDSFFMTGENVFFIKSNGSLWGMGQNRNGELGDGTRVPREEPVHIGDNVACVRPYSLLRQDGTLWIWSASNPTPQQALENIKYLTGRNVYLQNGNLRILPNSFSMWGDNIERGSGTVIDSVAFPRTLTFD